MRLPTPRVIAIDDDPKHLEGLAQGLTRYGTACLPVHFTGVDTDVSPCPQVRVIFADLHLSNGPIPGDHSKDFSVIGGLIQERIKPSGPYFIILWTMYPDQANKLQGFLNRLENVAKPFTVQALDKNKYLELQGEDVKVKNLEILVEDIGKSVEGHPQFGALLNWEERVLDGAADTLLSIMKMAESVPDRPGEELGRLLRILAEGAVGKDHVEDDRFRAVNDALLPILADRLASMRSQGDDHNLWQQALAGADDQHRQSLDKTEAARLNQLLHIAPLAADENQGERGSVIDLPEEFLDKTFANIFDISSEVAMKDQFRCKQSKGNEPISCRWVLVQTQAACDYAQNQPGPLPFHLGLFMLETRVAQNRKPPAALWCSPCFEYEQQVRCLHVSARFPVSLSRKEVSQASPLFRLREQLLNNLIYHLHSYGARPGIISFSS